MDDWELAALEQHSGQQKNALDNDRRMEEDGSDWEGGKHQGTGEDERIKDENDKYEGDRDESDKDRTSEDHVDQTAEDGVEHEILMSEDGTLPAESILSR